jgi:hypothetical protein
MLNEDSPTIIEDQAVTTCLTNKEKVSAEGTKEDSKSEDCCEMTAAAALTSLVDSPRPSPKAGTDEEDGEDEDDDDDDEERAFSLPQRYTRSGRKRAVSFPLKVSPIFCG